MNIVAKNMDRDWASVTNHIIQLFFFSISEHKEKDLM